jgi:hypothetical protein
VRFVVEAFGDCGRVGAPLRPPVLVRGGSRAAPRVEADAAAASTRREQCQRRLAGYKSKARRDFAPAFSAWLRHGLRTLVATGSEPADLSEDGLGGGLGVPPDHLLPAIAYHDAGSTGASRDRAGQGL